jgi:hypothetical protein
MTPSDIETDYPPYVWVHTQESRRPPWATVQRSFLQNQSLLDQLRYERTNAIGTKACLVAESPACDRSGTVYYVENSQD